MLLISVQEFLTKYKEVMIWKIYLKSSNNLLIAHTVANSDVCIATKISQ